MNEIFYQGDLQSGIATAMRDAKPVVCFVRDDLEESVTWESEFFDDEELSELLATRSVALRLIAGTQEAGFLTSICPIRNFPAVVVVRSGMLQEYIISGTPKDIFQARLKKAIGNPSAPPDSAAVDQPPVMNARDNTDNAATTPSHTVNTDEPHVSALPITRAQPIPTTVDDGREESVQVPTSQIITPETRTPLNRESIRAGKQPANAESAEQKKLSQEKEERRALQTKLQRERKEQMEERERIRNQIKKDQEARRRRADEEKQSSASATSPVRVSSSGGNTKTNTKSPSQYRLQIRLFDGKSVRNTFPSTATIRKDVRPWLESQRSDGTAPYNLKHILTPLPNHTISVAEEERTLEDLELGPTASLVMVPVPSYIEAYAPSGLINSAPARVVSSGFGLLSGLVGGVTGAVGGLLGYGNSNSNQETSSSDKQSESRQTSSPPAARSGQRINIRTLHDQRSDREEREFYNGNTLNFEPRRDDDSKDK